MGCSKWKGKRFTTEQPSNKIAHCRCSPEPNNIVDVRDQCIYKNDCECQSENVIEIIDIQMKENAQSQDMTQRRNLPQCDKNTVCVDHEEQNDENTVILPRNNQHENVELGLEISELQNALYEIHKQLGIPSGLRDIRRNHESNISKTKDQAFVNLERNKDRNVSKQPTCKTSAKDSHEKRFRKTKRFEDEQILLKDKCKKYHPQKYCGNENGQKQKMTIKKFGNRNVKTPLWLYDLRVKPPNVNITLYPVHRNRSASSLETLFQSMNDGEMSSQNGGMNFEWMRLRTFVAFNSATGLRPIVLSRIGFYYTGRESEVKCYSCGVTYNNWSTQEDPLQVHRRISPDCRHLAGTDERNISVGHRDASSSTPGIASSTQMNSDLGTLQRTNANSNPNPGSPNYEPSHNVVSSQPSQINRQIPFSSDTSTPTVHRHERDNVGPNQERGSSAVNGCAESRTDSQMTASPSTIREQSRSHQTNNQSASSATINKLSPLGVNFNKPRYPQYAVLTVRMSTYNGWPATQIPRKMAEAGFIYAGYADYARCFFCGGGLRNWEEGDDPWIEHARWFPRCAYVRQNKGDQFVQLVHERLQEMLRAEGNMGASSNRNQELQLQNNLQHQQQYESKSMVNGAERQPSDLKDLPSYQSVLELGYASDMIENTIKYLFREGREDVTSSDILQILFKIEEGDNSILLKVKSNTSTPHNTGDTAAGCDTDDREVGKIIEENRRLKQLKLCMICIEKDSCVTFLPCGHLVCCEECAPAMRKCPKCQQVVQGSIKTWLI